LQKFQSVAVSLHEYRIRLSCRSSLSFVIFSWWSISKFKSTSVAMPVTNRREKNSLYVPGSSREPQRGNFPECAAARASSRVYDSAICSFVWFLFLLLLERVALFGGMNRGTPGRLCAAYLSRATKSAQRVCCRSCTCARHPRSPRSTCKCSSLLYRDAATI